MTLLPDEGWMQLALGQARLAAALGEVPIGAVLRLPDGRYFLGHNETLHQRDASAHAEVVVIRRAAQAIHNHRLTGAELYVTLEPCGMCAGMIAHARIRRLIYGASDIKAGAIESTDRFFKRPSSLHKLIVEAGVLSSPAEQLLKAFFTRRR